MKSTLLAAALLVSLFAIPAPFAVAQPINGSLSIETPSSTSDERPQDHSTMLLGSLSTKLASRWTLGMSAQYNLGDRGIDRSIVRKEDKARATLSYALNPDLSVYSYYENRYSLDQARVVFGATYKFKIGK